MPTHTVPQAFALALEHHQAGRLGDAETLYRQILAVQPRHAEVWHRLGILAHQAGRGDLAVEYIHHATALEPSDAAAFSNLGAMLAGQDRWEEAVAAYRRALQLQPGQPETHNNLGNALKERGQFDEAIAAYREALRLRPDFATAQSNLGNALKDSGRIDEAIAAYHQALQLQPSFAEVHSNLGIALADRGLLDEAIGAQRRAIALKPDYAPAYNNLGNALKERGQFDEAMAAYRHALQLRPDAAETHNNLGTVLIQQSRLDEAVAAYRRALELQPRYAEAANNLGNAWKAKGELDESMDTLRRALELRPGSAAIHSSVILTALYHPAIERSALREETRRWQERHAAPLRSLIKPHRHSPDPGRRLKVGYVSPDFRDHVAGRNLIPLLQAHDHAQFEVLCYSGVSSPDHWTSTFRQRADQWRSTVGLPDEALAEMIRHDAVDILVDLTQHMAGNRLPVFARKPAPVLLSFLGYPESAGLDTIGYRISDRYLESELGDGSAKIGSERVCLIDSFWCYDPCGIEVEITEPPMARNGQVTFGSLNNFCKVNEPVLKLWARVLDQVDSSRLVLLSAPGSHRERTLRVLQREGVEERRVEFVEMLPRQGYLELYRHLDIVLDTFPYNGHTTSLDALWMGVPVVSLAGDDPVSRAGLSQLSNLGLPELAAAAPEEFVAIATRLAGDLPRLAEWRATLRARMQASPLMDATRFARQIEAVYRTTWRHWCARQA